LVDPRLVRQLGLAEEGTVWIVGIGTAPIEVPLVSVDSIAIGRCLLNPFKAGVVNLTHLRIGIQLVLGINAFRGYRLQFDLAAGRLYLLPQMG
jgi:hypothetical protein